MLDVDRLGGVGWGIVVRRPDAEEADLELGRIPKGRGRGRRKRGKATWDNKKPLLSRLDSLLRLPSSPFQEAKRDCVETNIQIVCERGPKEGLKEKRGRAALDQNEGAAKCKSPSYSVIFENKEFLCQS